MEELGQRIYKTVRDPPILRVISPLQRFIQKEATGSKILLFSILLGFFWINLPMGNSYTNLWNTEINIEIGSFSLSEPLLFWINDVLMAIFFFVIGLELKREILVGGLNNLKDASLSLFAALGGMIFPAVIYILFNRPGTKNITGWAIPMATDIALALGVLSLFEYRIPRKLKLTLTSMAIIDDLAAVLIIALFYSHSLNWIFLMLSLIIFGILIFFNRLGIRNVLFYIIPGLFLWFFILRSGIHATIAGILLAITIPATKRIDVLEFYDMSKKLLQDLSNLSIEEHETQTYRRIISTYHALEVGFRKIQSPLQLIEHKLITWVTFLIVPLFGLANAGVDFFALDTNPFVSTSFWGIVLGLIIGKPLGVFCFSWLGIKFQLANPPTGLNKYHLLGGAWLTGIGFTMSNFIASLAFQDNNGLLDIAKIGILIASIISGIIGYLLLKQSLIVKEQPETSTNINNN